MLHFKKKNGKMAHQNDAEKSPSPPLGETTEDTEITSIVKEALKTVEESLDVKRSARHSANNLVRRYAIAKK